MATQNPNENLPPVNDEETGEIDQSDALRRAILKLKESGMLTHVPDDLGDVAAAMVTAAPSIDEPVAANPQTQQSPPEQASQSEADLQPDEKTIASRPKPESPTIASTDDIEKHADEKAKRAAVMTGWDDDEPENAVPETSSAPPTIPSREALDLPAEQPPVAEQSAISIRRKEIKPQSEPESAALTESREETPWTLQQFFDGEIDLEQELMKRHQTIPAMTTFKTRTLGMNSSRQVATLSTQDGNAKIIIDADYSTKVVQFSFTYGSMMTLRFILRDVPAQTRERWLELMRRDGGGLAMLWNENRWRDDYLICVSRDYSTNIFAFSPRNFESAVRLTKENTTKLLDWLEEVWTAEPEPDDGDDSPLLTW